VTRFAPALSLYLGRQFLAALGGVLALFLGLILLFDTIELLRRTVRAEGAELSTLVGLALLKAPHTLQDTLPFAIMIAAMYALFRHSRHHELVIFRAAGLSAWQVLAPALVLAAALGVITLLVFNPLAAGLYANYERLKGGLIRNDLTALDIDESGFWLREVRGAEVVTLHARHVRQQPAKLELAEVTILVTDAKTRLIRRVEADFGELRQGAFDLNNVLTLEPGRPARRETYGLQPTEITLERVQDSLANPETLSFWDLPDFIALSQAAGFSARPHRLYLQSLMATPMLLCAMVLLAAAFFLTAQARVAAWTMRAAAGVAAGFCLYFFSQFTYALGLAATLPLTLAAWAPAAIALLLGLAYLFYREDG